MPSPKVSIIIAFYKDLEALNLIFEALRRQTYKNFEAVVAEDNDAPETKQFLSEQTGLEIVHICQPDIGRNKATAQNKAVCAATGDWPPSRRHLSPSISAGELPAAISMVTASPILPLLKVTWLLHLQNE